MAYKQQLECWDINQWASFSTICASLFGLLAVLVALATLLSGARTARLQHMHGIFKEYLLLQFEYNKAAGEGNDNKVKLRANLGGFKMYTLEEMTLWLRRERALGVIYFWSGFHKRHIESWKNTITWHLDNSSRQDFLDVWAAKECYGQEFRDQVKLSEAKRFGSA